MRPYSTCIMIDIKLPDGKVVQYMEGTTPIEVAKDISEGLARNVISARFNNRKVETATPLMEDGELVLYTWRDEEGKKAFWHSSSHVVAQALEELYPGIRLTIGPASSEQQLWQHHRGSPLAIAVSKTNNRACQG